jgi:hypothetical protein
MQVSTNKAQVASQIANLETRHVADSRRAVAGQRVVLLWNELAHGNEGDGRTENRLPIA